VRYLVLLVLAGIVIIWLVQRAHDDKKAEGAAKKETLHEQIDQATDYLTGKTQINAMLRARLSTRRIEIQEAVKYFQFMNGRSPKSLDELLEEGLLTEEQKYIRHGERRELLSSGLTPDGRFFVEWVGLDRKKGTKDDWHVEF